MMIHNSSSITMGTAKDHEKSIEAMERLDGEMAKLYSKRTGVKEKDAKAMMDDETWMTGEEAVKKGFATKAGEDKALDAAIFDYRLYARAPEPLRIMASANKFKFQESGLCRPPQPRLTSTEGTESGAAPGENDMDMKSIKLSDLREQRPDLVTEIEKGLDLSAKLAAATEEGKKLEAQRIAGIEAASLSGHDDLVAAHKADLSKTGADLALAIITAERSLRANAGDALLKDEEQVKNLRSEHRTANDPLPRADQGKKPGDGLEGEAKWKAEFAADSAIRTEFRTEAAYVAFKRADEKGIVRQYSPKRAA
jgi:hypothetical protein